MAAHVRLMSGVNTRVSVATAVVRLSGCSAEEYSMITTASVWYVQ